LRVGGTSSARALAKASAYEPGTVRYDWYQGADPADFVIIEEYVDSEAAFAHNARREELLSRPAEMTAVQLPRRTEPRTQCLATGLPIAKTHLPLG